MLTLGRNDVPDGSPIIKKAPVQNIELEELRIKALSSNGTSPQLTEDIEQLIESTSRIHAAFLFHSPKTLQPLLRAIGETNNGAIDAGWQMFGDKLGLDVSILKVINNNQFNHEDPVYNTLLHYVQYEDATIGKIIQALFDMGRLDVIMRSKHVLGQLADVILSHERELMLSSRARHDNVSGSDEASRDDAVSRGVLIKPALIPDAPFIIKNVQTAPLLSTLLLQNVTASRTNIICSASFSQALAIEACPETLVRASPAPALSPSTSLSFPVNRNTQKLPYTRKVMLTFAADGADLAANVARILRMPRGSTRIGVLILSEQYDHVQADPNLFITASFQMVDFVIPIITEGYLRALLKRGSGNRTLDLANSNSSLVDVRYVPFIYQMMTQDYAHRNCLNTKVRCIIPDDQLDAVLGHLMMASPLFSAWERSSNIECLAERILASDT